ncbi:MAG: hypothetical protein H6937_13585, partial [Burkholderiales bacterium]|nr:hypothetical protein [Burkholderiales bacterium]
TAADSGKLNYKLIDSDGDGLLDLHANNFHFEGPVQAVYSDDGTVLLYFINDPADSGVIVLGAELVKGHTWLNLETLNILSVSFDTLELSLSNEVIWSGGRAWSGARAWSGGRAWSGARAWSGGRAWSGARAWSGTIAQINTVNIQTSVASVFGMTDEAAQAMASMRSNDGLDNGAPTDAALTNDGDANSVYYFPLYADLDDIINEPAEQVEAPKLEGLDKAIFLPLVKRD